MCHVRPQYMRPKWRRGCGRTRATIRVRHVLCEVLHCRSLRPVTTQEKKKKKTDTG